MNKTILYYVGGAIVLVLILYYLFKDQVSNTITKAVGDSYNPNDEIAEIKAKYKALITASPEETTELNKTMEAEISEINQISIKRQTYKTLFGAQAPSYYNLVQLTTAIENKEKEAFAKAVKEYKEKVLQDPPKNLTTSNDIYKAIDSYMAQKAKKANDDAEAARKNDLKTKWANRQKVLTDLISNTKDAVYRRGAAGNKNWLSADGGLMDQWTSLVNPGEFWWAFEHAYISWANDKEDFIKDLLALQNNPVLYGKASIAARAILERRANGDWNTVVGVNELGETIFKK
ncbi:MAG: hypothetical protein EOL95_09830 [Bacteroidia bacterium]|nr:hypothetical protein [Bacteroidia bacterium]